MALSGDRNTPRRTGQVYSRPVAGGVKIYAGALVVLNASGFAAPGSTSATVTADGRAEGGADNTSGVDGAINVDVRPGLYRFLNSSGGDLIGPGNLGSLAYVVDDETVALTSAMGTRSIAGIVLDVDSVGVWVQLGAPSFNG